MGYCGRASVPHPDQVRVDHRAPVLGSRSVPRPDRQHTGVGDRSVQAAQFTHAFIDGFAQLGFVANVDDTTHTAAAGLLDETHSLGEIVLGGQRIFELRQGLTNVDKDEVRTFLGKP